MAGGRLQAFRAAPRTAARVIVRVLLLFAPLLSAFLIETSSTSHAQALNKPKVMIVMEEKVAGVFGTTGWETIGQAESTLAQKLIAAGFQVVDPQTVRRNIARDKALRLLEGDERAAALAGLQFGAQVVIIGTAISKNVGGKLYGTNMQSLHATVQARAVWSDDGRIIASKVAESQKAHLDEVQGGVLAIRDATSEIADALTSALLVTAVNRQVGGAPQQITLSISGLVSYRHLAFIQQFLESSVQGVKAVQIRQFAQGSAELGIDYGGRADTIAAQLASQKFTGFRLEPTSVTANRLDVRAVLQK
jgi:hypothetical protein